MRATARSAAALGLAIAIGCTGEEKDCTTEAVGSVNLSVVGTDGAPIPSATAVWSVDGGDPSECEAMPNGGFVCGWEVEGSFTVTASAPGYQDSTGTVTVGADECHVIPESLEIVLDTIDCTSEVIPSVIATVSSASGADLTDVAVSWTAETAMQPCDGPSAEGEWICGEEIPGTLTVEASADGHVTASEVVEVEADVCHVLTERVDFVLDPL